MKQTLLFLSIAFTLFSCKPKSEWNAHSIANQEEDILQQAKKGKIDSAQVMKLLHAYEEFAEKNPNDENTPPYLYKAADFYRYMHRPLKSIQLYDKIYKEYPKFDKHPYTLFLQGFIFENELSNFEAAKLKYNEFLSVFPNHPIAKDVKLSLDNLGKTPEQLIQEFMAKNDSTAKVL
jgi:tetratricopeptide (TPR) repeat protein